MNGDIDLKVRLNNIFWELGFYTRLEVKLAEYSLKDSSTLELTDIDVLGIRTHSDLASEIIVGDCTTHKVVIRSPIQRAFWLKGVMDFFGAKKGYLCIGSDRSIAENQRVVSSELGITILNMPNLTNLENRYESVTPSLSFSTKESWQYFEGNLTTLPNVLSPILEFRKHKYWLTPHHDRIHALISIVEGNKNQFHSPSRFIKTLLLDMLTLFSISILKMSSYALSVNPENPEVVLRSYFYGSYSEMRRREIIVENLRHLASSIPEQPTLFPNKDYRNRIKLDPEYMPQLFDIAYRLLNKPLDASQIPRFLQLVMFERVLYQHKNEKGIKYIEEKFSEITKKLARDIAKLLSDSTGIPYSQFHDI